MWSNFSTGAAKACRTGKGRWKPGARVRIALMTAGETSIAENIARTRERISLAAERAGRRAEDVTLIAISKTFPSEAIREAYAAGARHFGENRVQEWESKRPKVGDLKATWHLIGHLQSNKAKRAVNLFHTIDSVDSINLAQKLEAAIAGESMNTPSAEPRLNSRGFGILLEVHLAPEESKSGVEEAGLPALAEAVLALPHLDLRGLMTIPPFAEDPEQARPFFSQAEGVARFVESADRPRLAGTFHGNEPRFRNCDRRRRDASSPGHRDFWSAGEGDIGSFAGLVKEERTADIWLRTG